MDIYASGRTDNSNYYSEDSIDRDINAHNREQRRGRTRFSNGDAAARSSQRHHQENDQTRDRDLNYLNREQTARLTRRS